MAQVAIIDYGMGNLHSVASALHLVSPSSEIIITADPAE
ncbi:MAG: imidazole glycerol phosphate synthase subunit HisH, partial [Moraxellaceae bacterium]